MLARAIPRPGRLLLFVLVLYGFMWVKGWPRYYDDEELPPLMRHVSGYALGPHRVEPDHLVVSILTTATNVYTKLAPQLAYLLEEEKDPTLLFGDLQMNVGDWPVFDVLYDYTTASEGVHRELARYRKQAYFASINAPIDRLVESTPEKEAIVQARLAKYKTLQAMARAWEYRPERSWYAFVDDDTFVDRINVIDWLAQYDPKTERYFGNPPLPELSDPFAARGNSFIVSGEVMRKLFAQRKNLVATWQPHISQHNTALDLISAVLSTELNLSLQSVWPGMMGSEPLTVPYCAATWCERVLMMHKVPAHVRNELYLLQKNRTTNHVRDPIFYSTIWEHFRISEYLKSTRTHWDNLSSDPSNSRWNILFKSDDPNDGHAPDGEASAEACADSCEKFEYCVQWSYSSIAQENWNENGLTRCHLSSSVRFGKYAPPSNETDADKGQKWKSGWKRERFLAWTIHQRCKHPMA